MKKTIRLNKRELNRLISESVKRALNENTSMLSQDEIRSRGKKINYLLGAYFDFKNLSDEKFKLFLDTLENKLLKNKAKEIYRKAMNRLGVIEQRQEEYIKMNYGMQPNNRYDLEHMSKGQIKKYNEKNGPDFSEPTWHGFEPLD